MYISALPGMTDWSIWKFKGIIMDYNKILSDKAVQIKPSGIRRYFDMADQYDDCISLGVGEPDFKTPWHIRQVGVDNLKHGSTRYTANAGLLELRKSIHNYMDRRFGLPYDPASQIVVTVGGSEGIDAIFRALINPGDEILIPQPSFVCYAPLAELADGIPVILPTYEQDQFRLRPDIIQKAITSRTKILVMPYPNNPTGAVMTLQDYEAIADIIKGTDIIVLADEIYVELTYTGCTPVSFAQASGMYDHTVIINGFSKAYAMTGWRMGYACGPAPIIKQALKIHQFGIMSAPTTSQYAAIDALNNGDEDIQKMRDEYNMRRRYLYAAFREMNIPCFEPLGAFYMFPNISQFGMSSEEFCDRFLREKHVAVVPGTAFGNSGEGFLRISYAYSLDHLKKAMDRLQGFIKDK